MYRKRARFEEDDSVVHRPSRESHTLVTLAPAAMGVKGCYVVHFPRLWIGIYRENISSAQGWVELEKNLLLTHSKKDDISVPMRLGWITMHYPTVFLFICYCGEFPFFNTIMLCFFPTVGCFYIHNREDIVVDALLVNHSCVLKAAAALKKKVGAEFFLLYAQLCCRCIKWKCI